VFTGNDIQSIPFEVRRGNVESAASEAVASLLSTPPHVKGKSAREADGPGQGTEPTPPKQQDPPLGSSHMHDATQRRSKMPS
jgi:hypothetical protein